MLYSRVFLCLIQLCLLVFSSSSEDIVSESRNINGSHLLSRRKRYLVFPEGSSLQLVCEYVWPIVGQANIWVLAISAALAWQLPSKPEHVRYIKKLKKDGEKRKDEISQKNKFIYGDMKQSNKNYPSKQKYVNYNHQGSTLPFFLHPPPLQQTMIPLNYKYLNKTWHNTPWYTKDRIYPYKKMKYPKKSEEYNFYDGINYYKHPLYTELHRRSRRGLYPKIEQFFKAQKKDGRACLLRALCEVNRFPDGKGSFMQEIIKTIFRNKPSQLDDELDEYDHAASQEEDCSVLYPSCTYN